MKKKKILIVCVPNDRSGVPIYTKELIEMFHKGADLYLLTGENLGVFKEQVRKSKVQIVKFDGLKNSFSIRLLIKFLYEFKAHIRENSYDLIHIQGALFGLIGRVFSPRDVPLLYTYHGLPFDKGIAFFRRFSFWILEYLLLFSTCNYIALTERHKKILLNINKGLNVDVVPNFSRISPRYEDKRKTFDLISVAGFRPQKNHKLLFQIFSCLPDHINLVCVGPDTDTDEFSQFIDKFVPQVDQQRIHCVGSVENIENYYSKSFGFIQTSHYEGLSIAAVEARVCNLPLILTDTSGTDELLTDWTGLRLTGNHKRDAQNVSIFLQQLRGTVKFGSPKPDCFSYQEFRRSMSQYYE